MLLLIVFLAAAFLAYANGANDNLKGVATLIGSGTASYPRALAWGTATTFAGSVCGLLLAGGLVKAFSGKGVVPDALIGDLRFAFAIGLGAALTVFLATVAGLPVSTTHALVGALAGGAVAAAGAAAVSWGQLASKFALPLLLSPFIAAAIVAVLYPIFNRTRRRLGIDHTSELEVREPMLARMQLATTTLLAEPAEVDVIRYGGLVLGISAQRALDACHYLSAGAVSFARGLNDTPKIAALLLAAGIVEPALAMVMVGAGMAVGAVVQAAKVARTMSFDITPMNSGQGFTANFSTAFMVLVASRFGVPVSTTHVSVGSLFGLGSSIHGLNQETFRKILGAWVLTLPMGFVLALLAYRLAAVAGL